jgi:hypothetical protein
MTVQSTQPSQGISPSTPPSSTGKSGNPPKKDSTDSAVQSSTLSSIPVTPPLSPRDFQVIKPGAPVGASSSDQGGTYSPHGKVYTGLLDRYATGFVQTGPLSTAAKAIGEF